MRIRLLLSWLNAQTSRVGSERSGTTVLASDALRFYEEVERDRPFAIIADLPAMYLGYDTLAQLAAQPDTRLVAGRDPDVRTRFPKLAGATNLPTGVEVTDLAYSTVTSVP